MRSLRGKRADVSSAGSRRLSCARPARDGCARPMRATGKPFAIHPEFQCPPSDALVAPHPPPRSTHEHRPRKRASVAAAVVTDVVRARDWGFPHLSPRGSPYSPSAAAIRRARRATALRRRSPRRLKPRRLKPRRLKPRRLKPRRPRPQARPARPPPARRLRPGRRIRSRPRPPRPRSLPQQVVAERTHRPRRLQAPRRPPPLPRRHRRGRLRRTKSS